MKLDRRSALAGAGLAAAWSTMVAAAKPIGAFAPAKGPKSRVHMVNDLGGDFDGLFAAAHAVMSPSIDLRGLISSNAKNRGQMAARGMALGETMLRLMGAQERICLIAGAAKSLGGTEPVFSAGTQRIIDEAMRTDTRLPLFVAVGGGLTEVASALMLKPEIAGKMTLVWIGGGESGEYNFSIDPIASRFVFNDSDVPLWCCQANVAGVSGRC